MTNESRFHLQVSHRAMATEFAVFLPIHAPAKDVDVVVTALDRLEGMEQAMTIYDPNSELSQLNRCAGGPPRRISPLLFEVLELAMQISEETHGAFDITAGPLIEAWGFTRRSGKRPSDTEVSQALAKVGWDKVELDRNHQSARLAVPGMQLNLGAIGKGFALDCLCRELDQAGLSDYLIHGGNSSIAARGADGLRCPLPENENPSDPDDQSAARGWRIGLQHPVLHQRRIGGLTLENQALSTSGSGKLHFHHQGQRLGHVIDPRTGWPAGNLLALTVIDVSAARADALATALFVSGKETLLHRAANCPRESWIAVSPGERQGEVQIDCWNVPSWESPAVKDCEEP